MKAIINFLQFMYEPDIPETLNLLYFFISISYEFFGKLFIEIEKH